MTSADQSLADQDRDDEKYSDLLEDDDIVQAVTGFLAMSTSDPVPTAERHPEIPRNTLDIHSTHSPSWQSSDLRSDDGILAAKTFLHHSSPSFGIPIVATDLAPSPPRSRASSKMSYEDSAATATIAFISSQPPQIIPQVQLSSLSSSLSDENGTTVACLVLLHNQHHHHPSQPSNLSMNPISPLEATTKASDRFLNSGPSSLYSSVISEEEGTVAAVMALMSTQESVQPRRRYTAADFDHVPYEWVD